MLGFVQSWFAPTANPIGVDFGSDSLRMAQVEVVGPGGAPLGAAPRPGEPQEHRLVAAARIDVPAHLRNDPAGRMQFFAEGVRDLWTRGSFRGRKAVLALPAACMTIQHLRVPRMEEPELKKALPWEARGKLPYDPTHALLRHIVAGEIHQDGEQKSEVILLAAVRETVNQFLQAAARAKLDVVGMNVEPKAVVDCFGHVYRRRSDAEVTNLFVDIGCASTRAFIARGQQVLFARTVPIGGDHFTRAVAAATKGTFEDAKILRNKLAHAQAQGNLNDAPATPAGRDAGGRDESSSDDSLLARSGGPATPDAERVADACEATVAKLVEELALCRRYHEATFPAQPVDRLIFIGGEARQRTLCQAIARGLELAAQVGDPMVRMARVSTIGPESGIDRRLPQPDWAVALGLSMGPVNVPVMAEAK